MIGIHPALAPVLGPSPFNPTVFGYWNDFAAIGKGTNPAADFGTTADTAHWLVTLTNSANIVLVDDERNGVIRAGVTGTNNDKVSAQLNGSSFLVTPGKNITFSTRLRTSAIAGTTLAVGLAVKDSTTLLTNTTFATTPTDFIGFKVIDTAGTLIGVVRGAGTESTLSTGTTLANATLKDLAFEVYTDGQGVSTAYFYVDKVLVGRITTNQVAFPLATVGLSPAFEGKAQASTAFNLDIDYIGAFQAR